MRQTATMSRRNLFVGLAFGTLAPTARAAERSPRQLQAAEARRQHSPAFVRTMTAERTARQIPGARLVVVEGAPHGLPVTHRDELNRLIAEVAV